MKRILGLILFIASINSFASSMTEPQMLLLSCSTSSYPSNFTSIEVFGVLSSDSKTISDVAVVVGVGADVGPSKVLISGGTGIINSDSSINYKDVLEAGTTLSVNNNIATLFYQNSTTTFSDCK